MKLNPAVLVLPLCLSLACNVLGAQTLHLPFDSSFSDIEPTLPNPNVTASGGASINTMPGFARVGAGALNLDPTGGSDFLNLGQIDLGQTFTLAAWIKPDILTGSNLRTIFSNSQGGNSVGFRFLVRTDTDGSGWLRSETADSTGNKVVEAPVSDIQPGVYQHVAVTLNRPTGDTRLYLNGVEVRAGLSKTQFANNAATNRIGVLATSGNFPFDGAIDDFRLFNTILNAAEIAALAQASPPSNPPPSVFINNIANGATFSAPANITINATASDINGGTISLVEFFRNSGGAPFLIGSDSTAPYSATFTNAPAGSYALTAVARDNDNAQTTSTPINITVTGSSLKSYATNFDGPAENPLSEGGVWFSRDAGHTRVRKSNGVAFGTLDGQVVNFDDSYAILSGFAPKQSAEGTIFIAPGVFGDDRDGFNQEVEILLRVTDTQMSFKAYEVLLNNRGGFQVVKHLGPLNSFFLGMEQSITSVSNIQTGDKFKVTAENTTSGVLLKIFYNGVMVGTSTDRGTPNESDDPQPIFSTGNPGIGFFRRLNAVNENFGFTAFTATDLP